MATMKDVAKKAGVSVGTVSRYINNASGIKEKTRQAVKKAIDELNYVPDEYAKGMKVRSSQTVVLLIPTVWHMFFSEFAFYVEQTLAQNNYKMILCNSDHDPKKEEEYLQKVMQNKIDGVIGITYNNIDERIVSKVPFVSIDRYFDEKTSYVSSENYVGGKIAANVFLKQNLKNLLYIGDLNKVPNDTSRRREGFRDTILESGSNYYEMFDADVFYNFKTKFLNKMTQHPEIDGIFCVTDMLAMQVYETLCEIGIKVPKQVQIIGYDGTNLAKGVPNYCSTIAQPIELMAQKAVEMILAKIKDPSLSRQVCHLPVAFRAGKTTK